MDSLINVLTAQVSMIVEDMTRDELLAQRMATLLESSHQGRYGYEKIKPLLTQENGTKMHEHVRDAFLALSGQKLGI